MVQKIRKALIPAAGFGTRFLPQTKAMPKEMMPLVDKPIIQRVVEELVDAGIETIVIVTGSHKRSIEDHFDKNFELEYLLEKGGKEKELEVVRKLSSMAEFVFVRQKGPMGTGTPVLNVKHIMGDDPFLVFWGDEFVDAEPSRAKQLCEAYEKYGTMILGGIRYTSPSGYKKYGYIGGKKVENGIYQVERITEKPEVLEKVPLLDGEASTLVGNGGIVLTSDIFQPLEEILERFFSNGPVEGGPKELYLVNGTQGVIDRGIPVHAVDLKNQKYRDTGNKLDYLKTVVEYGIDHPEFGEEFKQFLKNLNL